MPFSPDVKEDALVACGRCCCICHKFCGTKIEVHHIREESEGGDNSLGNAIPVCFDCHADMRSYDFKHPKGNKYSESELIRHRDIWYEIQGKSKSELPKLQKIFPGGFETFGVLIGGSATAGHKVIRSSTSHSIDITWGNAAITELTPGNLTLQLQNLRIIRTETTPGGTQPAGTIQINGAAVWQIDRSARLVYINNAISFWGYVLGGFVISDTDDVLVVAIGLQRIEGT